MYIHFRTFWLRLWESIKLHSQQYHNVIITQLLYIKTVSKFNIIFVTICVYFGNRNTSLPVATWSRCLVHVFPDPGKLARAVLGKVPFWKKWYSGGHLTSDFGVGIRDRRMTSSRCRRWGLTVQFLFIKFPHCLLAFLPGFVTRLSSLAMSSGIFRDK